MYARGLIAQRPLCRMRYHNMCAVYIIIDIYRISDDTNLDNLMSNGYIVIM